MTPTTTSNRLSTVKVRLSDSAVLAGTVSLLYALALVIFPRAFPEFLQNVFDWAYFFPALAVLLVVTNEILFVFICRRRAEKPTRFTPLYIAFLTAAVVMGFRQLMIAADLETQISHLLFTSSRGQEGISSEEVLVYTHLALVSGIFLPYVLVRATQNYYSGASSPEPGDKARHAAAGQ